MNRQRVDPGGECAGQRGVDHAMALQPALSAKRFRHNIQAEMGLAAGPMPGVTFVPVGFVFDVQVFGRESFAQLFSDDIRSPHRPALSTTKQRGQ